MYKEKKDFNKYLLTLIFYSFLIIMSFSGIYLSFDKIAKSNLWGFPVALTFFSVIGILFSIKYSKNWYSKFLLKTSEFRLAIALFIFSLNIIFYLLAFGVFKDIDEFSRPKIEWFIGLFSVIGLIGAIWAVWAKVKADNAFEKASEASDNAVKAYKMVGGIVDFEELLVPSQIEKGTKYDVPMLNDLLDIAHDKLIMILGVPAVGFFREDMRDKSLTFCDHITHTIREIIKKNKTAKIRLIFMSLEKINELIDITSYSVDEKNKLKLRIKNPYEGLVNEIKLIKEKNLIIRDNKIDIPVIDFKEYNFDPGLRFVLSISKEPGKLFEKKAVVWIVPDMATDPIHFKSAGYTTRDNQIIDIFEKLADYYIKNLN